MKDVSTIRHQRHCLSSLRSWWGLQRRPTKDANNLREKSFFLNHIWIQDEMSTMFAVWTPRHNWASEIKSRLFCQLFFPIFSTYFSHILKCQYFFCAYFFRIFKLIFFSGSGPGSLRCTMFWSTARRGRGLILSYLFLSYLIRWRRGLPGRGGSMLWYLVIRRFNRWESLHNPSPREIRLICSINSDISVEKAAMYISKKCLDKHWWVYPEID